MNANSSILAAFATIGMMYAARLAGMDWEFTLLVGCCIGLTAMQGLKHKAEQNEVARQRKAADDATRASEAESAAARSRKGKKSARR
ncbi:MAG: hypothetical protein OSB29_01775 [Verrucomicrobiota bacterium]|nr:hypothetical protein [Verrucomicrobiota bacterium]